MQIALASKSLTRGESVRGFVWPGDRQAEKLALLGAEVVEGDLASAADVRRAAEDQDVILTLTAVDDWLRLWLNGKLVHEQSLSRVPR